MTEKLVTYKFYMIDGTYFTERFSEDDIAEGIEKVFKKDFYYVNNFGIRTSFATKFICKFHRVI